MTELREPAKTDNLPTVAKALAPLLAEPDAPAVSSLKLAVDWVAVQSLWLSVMFFSCEVGLPIGSFCPTVPDTLA